MDSERFKTVLTAFLRRLDDFLEHKTYLLKIICFDVIYKENDPGRLSLYKVMCFLILWSYDLSKK